MITRRKDYEKQAPTRDARKIYILCEGKGTEPDYFTFFEGLSSNLELIVIPPENGTDPLKLEALAKQKFFDENSRYGIDYVSHDTIWFVIDTDSWEEEGKIAPLRQFCASINDAGNDVWKKYNEVKPYAVFNVAQSNPSFEIWLYYHIFPNRPQTSEVEDHLSFKEFVNNKISGGFNFQSDPARLREAIANARQSFASKSDGTPSTFSTEVYHLGEEIYPLVQQPLERLKGKML